MSKITISQDGERFLEDGTPFFWVGDTVWSAFTNAAPAEWEEYLDFRAAQGFNVLLINTLPQWDRVRPDLGIYPYPMRKDGSLDYTAKPDPVYTDRARLFLRMAAERGFHPVLVADWADIVPDTWLAKLFPSHVWPVEAIEEHAKRIASLYGEFFPFFMVSGDTDAGSERTEEYYLRTAEILRQEAPDSLLTMHLCGGSSALTPSLAASLDFYVYQSGHNEGSESILESLPAVFRSRFPKKPLLNAEPCYEEMPHIPSDGKPSSGVYHADDVLDACRRSILAGASAGITYGANGLWSWKRPEGRAEGLAADLYGDTPVWRDAMRLPGAARIASLRELVYPPRTGV